MKKLRVLFLETHYNDGGIIRTHGVDYARVVNPGKYLANHPDFHVEVRKDPVGKGNLEKNWDELTKHWDIIFTSYIDSPKGYVHLALYAKKNGAIHICDVDDNLWEVPEHSPTYKHFHLDSGPLHFVSCALEDTPYITTTNAYLKYKLMLYLKKPPERVEVLPNYIDLQLYNYKDIPKKPNPEEIVIGYYGTNTHTKDVIGTVFYPALIRVLKEHPNVYFETTGFFLPQLKSRVKKQYRFNLGAGRFEDWIGVWQEIMSRTDITVAPLEDTDFNKSKSGIKYLECAAAKKPIVCADIRQYQELCKQYDTRLTGYLAKSEGDWYRCLTKLVESEEARVKMGNSAYNFVKNEHTIQGNIEKYADYFKAIYANHKPISNLTGAGFLGPDGAPI